MNADELSERLDYNERVIGTKILRAMLIIASIDAVVIPPKISGVQK